MLFDLRGRGRRRTVQAVYLGLAILLGGGLVLFGIGSGNLGGGLLDAVGLGSGKSGGTQGGSQILVRQEKAAARRVVANPRDAAAWAQLTRVRYTVAGQGDNYNQATGTFTAKGRAQLVRAAQAWERYLALDPPHPNANVARLMVQAYSPLGLNQPAKGVRAAEIVADAQPSSQTYYQLAVYAYAAGQTRKGDLAGQKSVQLAPPQQRAGVKSQVDAAKSSGGFGAEPGGAGGQGAPAGGGQGSPSGGGQGAPSGRKPSLPPASG